MTLDFGYLIAFVLTAFSTIATILPFLKSSDNQSPDIFKFQALHTLIDRNNTHLSIGDRLLAEEILHEQLDPKNATCLTDPNVCIAYAAMNYNLNPTSTQIPNELIQANSSCKDISCLEKIWYLYRLYNLSKPIPYLSKIDEDSVYCKETGYKCTQEELNQTTRTISNLSQIGYTSIFDNNVNALGLGTALDTFISDLNTFIIVAFITGPVVFIVAIKTMGRQKS